MIKVDNLTKIYDNHTKNKNEVLHGVSFTLPDKGFVCILGASGCGKTSLLNAIGGLDTFDGGSISVDGTKIGPKSKKTHEKKRNDSFGYIFQNYYLLKEHSAAYNVYIGMHSLPISHKEKLERVKDALSKVDMLRYKKRPVGELSGGQQQRIAIARAIARRPRVIFADEPTGNLDGANTVNICSILKDLSHDSLVVMVTHEEKIARFFADRIITLKDGRIVSDTADWERTALDAGAKDTLYSGDYCEDRICNDTATLRVLTAENAPPISLTVIAESDRIVIKVDDSRAVICSEKNDAPYLSEGKRPMLSAEELAASRFGRSPQETNKETVKSKRRGVGFSMLLKEAGSLSSTKKIRRFGTGLFLVLLSIMLSLSVADIMTVANIDPEDFITTDSHTLSFHFERGALIDGRHETLESYRAIFIDDLNRSGADIDYIPRSAYALKYSDSSVPQLGQISMSFNSYSWANISRLDPSDITHGRMPERSDEIVIDRWVLDVLLKEDGILQNLIPNPEYMLGKTISSSKMTYTLKIVGICDSGEPTMYMSREAMLAFGACGTEVITLSEYRKLTGDSRIDSLAPNQCVVLTDNAPLSFSTSVNMYVGSNYYLRLKDKISDTDDSIGAKLIISDDALDPLYDSMIAAQVDLDIWCSDKQEVYSVLDTGLSESLANKLDIELDDRYATDLAEYEEKTAIRLDARRIVTLTVMLSCAIMLYFMQRSRLRERMDLITVYRLLGIPKKDLTVIFSIECILLNLKYTVPTVCAVWLAFMLGSFVDVLEPYMMIYPWWAALITILLTVLFQLIISILPVLRLLSKPPARLASRRDL